MVLYGLGPNGGSGGGLGIEGDISLSRVGGGRGGLDDNEGLIAEAGAGGSGGGGGGGGDRHREEFAPFDREGVGQEGNSREGGGGGGGGGGVRLE